MEKMSLCESPVVFDSEHHTYTLNGHVLSGVTPIIRWLFPDTYKGIPQAILDTAAEYGSMVHSKCELFDSMGILTDEEPYSYHVKEYKRVISEAGLEVACSEYLVSDEHRVASAIDKVFKDDSLGDIKTTSKVHWLNVQVQLSIYAWLYELQTGRKANRLYLIWLPKQQYGQSMVKELERIPASVCEYIVEVWAAGGDQLSAISALTGCGVRLEIEKGKRVEGEIPEDVQPLVDELIMVKKQLDILDAREKELRKALLDTMTLAGDDKWSNDLIQFSRRSESERVSIDTKALQKNEPSIFEKYKKVTKVAASLTYKLL